MECLFAVTSPGLEPVLEEEIRSQGVEAALDETQEAGGVAFHGPKGLHRRANLWLRTASRIFLRLGAFSARDEGSFSRGIKALPLARYGCGQSPVELSIHVHRSLLKPARMVALCSAAWRLRLEKEGVLLQLRLVDDLCTVSIDTSGELLYRRGYRQEVSHAPMRETLAAGVLHLAGYTGDMPLWDPMCGSGTLPIEATWMLLNRAPGINRHFAFEQWADFDPSAWSAERDAARRLERPSAGSPKPAIFGSDLNAGALGTARRNARRADVTRQIRWERQDVKTVRPDPGLPPGLVVANPPYGVRIGDPAQLAVLYRQLGQTLATAFRGWRAAVLVADPKLEPHLFMNVEKVFPIENGGISCRLLVGRSAINA